MISGEKLADFRKTSLLLGKVILEDDEYSGYVLTAVKETVPFDELVVSWNGFTPGMSSLKIEVQVKVNGSWSDFYPIALWNQFFTGGSFSKEDAVAKTLIDLLKVKNSELATAYRVRVWLRRNSFREEPRLTGIYVSTRNSQEFKLKMSHEIAPIELAVPTRSQMIHHQAYANQICSPTCCGMVLGYYDIYIPTDQIIWEVFDKTSGIFGNWPFNTAALGCYGFEAKVEFMTDLTEALREIEAGRPIITGVRYQEGQLENAAIAKTNGHIIVLVGYQDNHLIVNDSAAPANDQVRRKYRLDQFLEVCSGVFYTVKKPS